MDIRNKQWWLGILVNFLQGGYGAIAGTVGASVIDPAHFNVSDMTGVGHLGMMAAMSFLGAGVMHAAVYLVRKPVPPTVVDELSPEDQAALKASALSTRANQPSDTPKP